MNLATIHIYMEIQQGNSLCNYLKLGKKISFSENKKVEQVLPKALIPVGEERR
jgi:hypothetical protein